METLKKAKPNSSQTEDILTLTLIDKNALYAAYMSFLQNGGLFVPTKKNYQLNDEVFIILKLPECAEKISIAGKVVWITPHCAQGGLEAGVGVEFADAQSANIRNRIETLLAGLLGIDKKTETM